MNNDDQQSRKISTVKHIDLLPVPNCRRSKIILTFLDREKIPYNKIDLLSTEGLVLLERYQFRASPGILVNGKSINPYDVMNQRECSVDRKKILEIL